MNLLSTISIVVTIAAMRASAVTLFELQGRGCMILSFDTSPTDMVPIAVFDAVQAAVISTAASKTAGVERTAATEPAG